MGQIKKLTKLAGVYPPNNDILRSGRSGGWLDSSTLGFFQRTDWTLHCQQELFPKTIITPIGVITSLCREPRASMLCFLVNERPHKERGATGLYRWCQALPNKSMPVWRSRNGMATVELPPRARLFYGGHSWMICFEFGLHDNNDGGSQRFRGSSGESDRRMMDSFGRRLIGEFQKIFVESEKKKNRDCHVEK